VLICRIWRLCELEGGRVRREDLGECLKHDMYLLGLQQEWAVNRGRRTDVPVVWGMSNSSLGEVGVLKKVVMIMIAKFSLLASRGSLSLS